MSVLSESRARLHTVEDLERLDAQGLRYELIRGDLQEMSPAGGRHGSATSRFAAYAGIFVDENGLGECFAAETGFLIGRNPDTVLAPDWAFVAEARLPDLTLEGYVSCVPDAVLETRSPNDTKREVAEKVARWLEAGVGIVLELNPNARALTVYRPGEKPRTLGIEDTFSGEDVLPGLTLPVRRLFREVSA